uniref:Uncharacterized protein n=1 Tax=Balaenoptera musculus TaxID=9771 RepID=A0A8C0CM33_BALMU
MAAATRKSTAVLLCRWDAHGPGIKAPGEAACRHHHPTLAQPHATVCHTSCPSGCQAACRVPSSCQPSCCASSPCQATDVPVSRKPGVHVPVSREPGVHVPVSREPVVHVPVSREPGVHVPVSRDYKPVRAASSCHSSVCCRPSRPALRCRPAPCSTPSCFLSRASSQRLPLQTGSHLHPSRHESSVGLQVLHVAGDKHAQPTL